MDSSLSTPLPPCVLHEDEHLLVVNKPAGWNTHSPSPYAGEGIYEWLKHREARWANLAIIHRLDKETSGVMVFGKTQLGNRSLTEQFAGRSVRKRYVLLSHRQPERAGLTVTSRIIRAGDRYVSGPHGEEAETVFKLLDAAFRFPHSVRIEAEPLTGRTHQIRVHAAANGFPILGDALYGGAPFDRLCLHAQELALTDPATGKKVTFSAPADFTLDATAALRGAIIHPQSTDAFRLTHGASDRWPGWYVEQFSDYLLSQSESPLTDAQQALLRDQHCSVYHKVLSRYVRGATVAQSSPQLVLGPPAPERFIIQENGVKFEISFNEGYSVGLFLDQRENRRRLSTRYIAAEFSLGAGQRVLNTFAYTCGFSVCAALAGAHTTSLDLSKKYLDWGKRNFALNGLDAAQHDFIYGDTFDWLKRFARKGRRFDAVILDPPTFSQSKEHGVFRAEKDYGKLVKAALPVLNPGAVLFASTNAAELAPGKFLGQIAEAVASTGRKMVQQHYVPQPPDFPISRAEPAYLKTVWVRVS
jgi:23S rRNA (cytosine1962-C5)-methyltransferase